MRFARAFLLPALALAAGYLAATAALPPATAVADGAADPWGEIKTLEKSKDAKDHDKCVSKMQEYKDSGGPAALKNLVTLRTSKVDKIAVSAIKTGAVAGDMEHHKWLAKQLEDKDLAEKADKGGRPDVFMAVLEALVSYGENNKKDGVQKALEDVMKKYVDANAEYTTRAVRAYATVPDKFTFEKLLELGKTWDGRTGGKGGQGGKSLSAETKENAGKARDATLLSLNAMTEQDISDFETYEKWWKEKGAKFVFPKPKDPNAPPEQEAAVVQDPSKLNEYVDEAYGYSVKRPQVENWTFRKSDYDGPRVALMYNIPSEQEGGKPYDVARAYYSILLAKKFPSLKDPKAFVEWAKTKVFADQLDTHEKPLDVSEKTFGGATWTVIAGKGDGINGKQGWGTMERRYYFTQLGANILYIDGFIRLGSEKEEIELLWKTVESTVITPPKK